MAGCLYAVRKLHICTGKPCKGRTPRGPGGCWWGLPASFGGWAISRPSWDPILGYINEQYERYLQEEILITRQRHIPDTRVHCCIYFVPPTGHW